MAISVQDVREEELLPDDPNPEGISPPDQENPDGIPPPGWKEPEPLDSDDLLSEEVPEEALRDCPEAWLPGIPEKSVPPGMFPGEN
jgi:hypothetical protein